MVDAYAALGAACEAQRVALLEGAARLRGVEEQRVDLIKGGLGRFVKHYRCGSVERLSMASNGYLCMGRK